MRLANFSDVQFDDPLTATPKTLVEPLRWPKRHRTASAVSMTPLEAGGLIIGDLIAVVIADAPRCWTFKLRASGREILRWDYEPVGTIRKHRNPGLLPPGFTRNDRSLVHEHPWLDGGYDRYSWPLAPDNDTTDHAEAFAFFCERSNVTPGDNYRKPPVVQLPMEPS